MVESIGERIKSLRLEQELTLAELAEKSKLSASHLSQVERDKSTPSLMTLASIAQALEINLRNLFESEGDQIYVARAADGPEEKDETSQVLRLPLSIPDSSWKLEVDRLTLHPDSPCLEFEPYPGEVMGFVLDGALVLVIDEEQIKLGAGDSIHYDANQPYRMCCYGERPCSVIWCSSPPRRGRAATRESELADVSSFE